MASSLAILAGPRALAIVRERGLRAEDIDMVVAASGGPKWLAVGGLDRQLFAELGAARRSRPLHLIGSSIGAWRMACLAQADATAALDRAHEAYIEQRYPPKPPAALVSATAARMLDTLLGASGEQEILAHPWARLHILASEFRGLLASRRRGSLVAGLGLAALGNLLARSSLGLQTRRIVVHNAGEASPLSGLADLPTRQRRLDAATLRPALLASASLPVVMEGVRIPGGDGRPCMDGGIIDYHPAFDFGAGDGLVLYPHYFPHVVPGWFDKTLPWRRARSAALARVLLIAPSGEFVAGLPRGRIPDRDDFLRLGDAERVARWRSVLAASERLGDELHELRERGRLADRVRPL